jgi:Tol biopolymer transport system component
VSAHGRYIAFESAATNLVPGDTNSRRDVFVRDLKTGTTQRISVASDGSQSNGDNTDPAISGDGRYVTFTSTASNLASGASRPNVYIRDRWTGTTSQVSDNRATTDYLLGSISMSMDGHHVAFASSATDLVPHDTNGYPDVFIRHTSP